MFVDAVSSLTALFADYGADYIERGKCDASKPYAEVGDTDSKEGGDLTTFSWIKDFTSYMCFTEIEDLRRFVRVARLRVAGGRV